MSSTTLFLITTFIVTIVTYEFSETCENPIPIDEFDENLCVSNTWYQYAGNIPCENCCVTRTMTLMENGSVNATDVVTKNNNTTVYNIVGKKRKTISAYDIENSENVVLMIDTDCKNYAILYEQLTNTFQVFTTQPKQNESLINSLGGIKKCNMKIHLYNPELAC